MNTQGSRLPDHTVSTLFAAEFGLRTNAITPLRGGAWSSVVAVNTDAGDWVLRCSATDDDFRRDAFACRFAGPHLPIPRVLGVGKHDTTWWCVSERMPGEHLDDLDAAHLAAVLPSLAESLIAMRAADPGDTRGFGSWDVAGNGQYPSFADQLLDLGNDDPTRRGGGWRPFLARFPDCERLLNRGIHALKELTPYLDTGRYVIHMDTINRNVNVVGDRISGIYDWGCGMWGDPTYDLAWFAFWAPWYPQWAAVDLEQELLQRVGIDGNHAEERMICCKLHIGLSHIQYNAFTENAQELVNVTRETERLLVSLQ